MHAESHLELCHLLLLNANRQVVHLQEQVRFAFGRADERLYVFDASRPRSLAGGSPIVKDRMQASNWR